MYLNPESLTHDECRRVDRWLVANGCRHEVALEPIILHGKIAEYYSICRRGHWHKVGGPGVTVSGGDPALIRRRLRIRVPLSAVQ